MGQCGTTATVCCPIVRRLLQMDANATVCGSHAVHKAIPCVVSAAGSNSLLHRVLANEGDSIKQVLGRPIQDCSQQPCHAVVIARSPETIGSSDASCSFEVVLTQPTFRVDREALCQVGAPLCSSGICNTCCAVNVEIAGCWVLPGHACHA